ncbi:MAG: riboflavin synthase [Candidatus Tectomicrobia bacterium]|nr:riboflavin synthase [Candidatus Tectomicrobia bacterium]
MFTGIVEEIGKVTDIKGRGNFRRMTVAAQTIIEGIHLGDSISISGADQTVVAFDSATFTFESSFETLARTTFRFLKRGDFVNLERSLQPISRISGHFVLGHVDGVGTITEITPKDGAWLFAFTLPEEFRKFITPKGSIAIDGISLTIVDVYGTRFTVAVIPYTFTHTTFQYKKSGDLINFEVDVLARYLYNFLKVEGEEAKKPGISLDMLKEHGFL